MGAGWLNLGSLVLGLAAWVLPIINIARRGKAGSGSWAAVALASVFACAVALCLQIFYTNHLVGIQDWSALMDTSSAVALSATVLVVVTIVLNAAAWAAYYGKKR